MKVLVCGGRHYKDKMRVFVELNALRPDSIIQGGCTGPDRFANEWALGNNLPSMTFYADWKHEGAAAGPIRNQRMLDEGKPDIVLAFPGKSGTADMVKRAAASGVRVIQVSATATANKSREHQ